MSKKISEAKNNQPLILKNAISSLRIGLEDYELSKSDPDRMLSSIRNIYASLLLFLKAGLCQYSPAGSNDVLIKTKILPKQKSDGTIVYIGKGKQTVDVQGIKDRYNSLDISIKWDPLLNIQKERNNIEHFYSETPIEVIQSLICKASTFIIEILKKIFKTDPSSLLGLVWDQMMAIKKIYEPIKEQCNKSFEILKSKALLPPETVSLLKKLKCNNCQSPLLFLLSEKENPIDKPIIDIYNLDESELVCFSCHEKQHIFEALESYADEMYEVSIDDFKFGVSPIVKECPECRHETFIDSPNVNTCIFCGHEKNYDYCKFCEAFLTLEEQDYDGLCCNCDYRMSIDD